MFAMPRNNLRAAISKCLSLCLSILSPLTIARHIAFGASSSATLTVTATVVRSCQFSLAQGIAALGPVGGGQRFDSTKIERPAAPCPKGSNAARITIGPTHYHAENNLDVSKTEVEKVSDRVQTELIFTNTATGIGVKISNRISTTPLAPKIATPPTGNPVSERGASENATGSVTVTIDF